MTSDHETRDGTADDALARAARRAHAASLEHLSPKVQAQLAQRRRAARAPRAAVRHGTWIAAGTAAALALAVGIFILRDAGSPESSEPRVATATPVDAPVVVPAPETQAAPDVRTASIETAPDTAANDSVAAPVEDTTTVMPDLPDVEPETLIAAEFEADDGLDYATFDETPDFYAWLGSEDALAAAPESL